MLTVLITEDQTSFRLALKAQLARIEEIQVVGEAVDGGKAVEAAKRLRPDVVLMDIQMPFLDGIEATRRLKQQMPGIAVVMLTAHNDAEQIFASFAAGADGYCLKGAQADQLAMAISVVADGSTWLDPDIARRVIAQAGLARARTTASPPSGESRTAQDLGLSEREQQILRLVAEGMSNCQIASELAVNPETIKADLGLVMDKLSVCDRTQAALKALRQGLL